MIKELIILYFSFLSFLTCLNVLKSMQRFMATKIEKQERRTRRFNVVRLIAYIHGNKERGFLLYIKLGLHKRVFILTLRNENFKNTPEPYRGGQPQPIIHPTTKEVQA